MINKLLKKLNRFNKNNILVILGFVVWFFKIKNNTLPPQDFKKTILNLNLGKN
ncbi:hypothetical protein SKUN_001363 [Spiroplasma kunkelii CR2-3x]|uniref:Uncharacterized protein n=1 Tax=Spiroplasma kunkelii CR2-3x TaxID=273035 RepID=A0A0K2JI08_SPIKU|nr:hypothetical protein [Spiroplasma kunkelii]ALA98230.1 hypothetical protein SKUN_001363 [Spiroplasma kunkelii CR2-3x]